MTSPRPHARVAFAVTLALVFTAAYTATGDGVGGRAAFADTAPEAQKQARRSFEQAEAHFRAGLFAEALAEYQAGYDVAPLPGFLINIAQCQRRLGDLTRARATYRKFILVAPDSPFVPQVTALIAELDKLASDLDGPGASAEASPNPGNTAPAAPVAPTVGGPLAPAGVSLVSAPPPPTAVRPKTETRWWLWGVVGTAVAVGAVTAFIALRPGETTTLHDGTLGTLRR